MSLLEKFSDSKISERATPSLFSFGISIPTVFLPGMIATRADKELVFLAISSDKLIILETLIPAAGSNSYKLTTGPLLTFFILPLIPKSKRIFSIKLVLGFFEFKFFEGCFFSNNFIEGISKIFFLTLEISVSFLNKNDCCFVSVSF